MYIIIYKGRRHPGPGHRPRHRGQHWRCLGARLGRPRGQEAVPWYINTHIVVEEPPYYTKHIHIHIIHIIIEGHPLLSGRVADGRLGTS